MMALTDNRVPEDLEGQRLTEVPEDLFERYHRPVVAFFIRRGFSVEESRDLAQETFLRVYKYWGRFRGESSLGTWLFQIAANLYKNKIRSLAAKKREGEEMPLDDSREPESEEDVLRMILLEERARFLWQALEELPPQMKKAVMLRLADEMKYREIAEKMDVSIETVKAHLYQARQHLRDRLSDYFTDKTT